MDQNDEMNVDEIISSLDELVKDYHPAPPEEPEPNPEEVSGDTIRLDQICKAVSEVADDSLEHTAVFTAVSEDVHDAPAPVAVAPAATDEEVEPFSEEWEPEYEDPMGDYPTPEPIAFIPKPG
jgi:hypothetical protein